MWPGSEEQKHPHLILPALFPLSSNLPSQTWKCISSPSFWVWSSLNVLSSFFATPQISSPSLGPYGQRDSGKETYLSIMKIHWDVFQKYYNEGLGLGGGKEESSEHEKHAPNCLHPSAYSVLPWRLTPALAKQNLCSERMSPKPFAPPYPTKLSFLLFLLVFPSSSPLYLDLVSCIICSWELSPGKRPLG